MKLKYLLLPLFLSAFAPGLFGQAALTISSISGHAGTYSLNEDVTFSFTLTNTAPEAVEADPPNTNDIRTAKSITLSGTLTGTDFYGNPIEIDFSGSLPSVGDIGPQGSVDIEGTVTIPNDGTLHDLREPGYQISVTVEYESGPGPTPSTITASSTPTILVQAEANLILENVAYLPGTYEGGDLIQVTAFVRNDSPVGVITQTRPLGASDDYRTSLFLSEDPSLDSGSDFLLGFFGADGSSVGALAGSVPTADTTVRIVRVEDTPGALPLYDGLRNYRPQTDDGILDIGEMIVITMEVLVPNNFPGAFFVGGYTDSLEEITENEEGNDASTGDQGDNIFVQQLTPQISIRSSATPNTEPVSEVTDTDGGQIEQSNGVSDNPSVSEDGVWIAFESSATNLDPDIPGNGNRQIYLRNRETREVILISASAAGVGGNRDSRNPAVSADGRFVAYESAATNLLDGIQGAATQIYVYGRESGNTARVSVSEAGLPGNGSSFAPAISESGRFVAFESNAFNLDPDFQDELSSGLPMNQIFLHDRDSTTSGLLDEDGNIATFLVSVGEDGEPADAPATQAAIAIDASAVAFVSNASNLDASYSVSDFQVWKRSIDLLTRVPTGDPEMISVDAAGVPGNDDSTDPAVNGGESVVPYGLQIAYSSKADNLVADDTNEVADIFVRDFSDPADPETRRVSVSTPRAATGVIVFQDPDPLVEPGDPPNVPNSQPDAGDTITIDDGDNMAVTFTFVAAPAAVHDVEIGATSTETRDNLVAVIQSVQAAGDLNVAVYGSSPGGDDPYFPGLTLISTTPGAVGNEPIIANSPNDKIFVFGMSGGGTEAFDAVSADPNDPFSEAQGNLQPSLDRSGRLVAFRSIARNLDIVREAARFKRNAAQPNADMPGEGVLIRPLFRALSSNVYYRDRDVTRSGALDDEANADTIRASVNRFGYPTNRLLNIASSGSNRAPAFSANGRIIAFASDAENTAGLRFGRTNTDPLDTNGLRDVYLFDRLVVEDIGGGDIVPRILTQPVDQNRIPGRSVAFVVEAVGVAPLSYQWQKDGISVSNTSRISGAATSTLTLNNLQPSDSGNYRVVVQNDFGTVVSRSAVLDVDPSNDPGLENEAPVIQSQPQNLSVGEGNPAIFSVTATGIPSPSYQWFKNGSPLSNSANISGVNTSQLEIAATSAADAALYTVEVGNVEGAVISSAASLSVGAAPAILTDPAGGEFPLGAAVPLSVSASGGAPLSFQWFKDGFLIQGATTSVYEIASLQLIDAGSYTVEVTAANGSKAVSSPAEITIEGVPGGGGTPPPSSPGALAAGLGLGAFTVSPDGWIDSPSFGPLYLVDDSPATPGVWAYSPVHGWLAMVPAGSTPSGASFWIFDGSMGWFWTAEDIASAIGGSYFYNPDNGGWLFHSPGSSSPRWFFSFASGIWTNL